MRMLYESAYGQMGDHREENLEEGTVILVKVKDLIVMINVDLPLAYSSITMQGLSEVQHNEYEYVVYETLEFKDNAQRQCTTSYLKTMIVRHLLMPFSMIYHFI